MTDQSPNLDGFIDAQRRLRDKLGRDVTFFTPVAPTYDAALSSAAFDPETGFPFDPTIEPTSQPYASAVVRGSRVFKPLALIRGESNADELGTQSRLNQQIIVDIDDFDSVKDAEFYEFDGERWHIVDTITDGIGSEQRVMVFGRRGEQ